MNAWANYRSPEGYAALMRQYDLAIERWPVPCEQQVMATRLGETSMLSFGDPGAPPLILLHGGAGNSSSWGLDAAAYARHFRVHAVDLPGETGRTTPARPAYQGSAYPDWLGDVFDALGIQAAMIAGLSLGGWVALKFAMAAPDRVQRLVLIAPGGIVPARKRFVIGALAVGLVPRWGIPHMTRTVFAPNEPPPGAAEAFGLMAREFKPRRETLPCLSDAELRAVKQPVLLIAGEGDRVLDMPATKERLSRLVPDFECQIIAGAGHALLSTAERAMAFLCRSALAESTPAH